MEEEKHTPDEQFSVLDTEHQTNLPDGKVESKPGVRKSSRPRKQSKRVLDSAECEDDELLGIPLRKKHRKGLNLRTRHRKDILQNGRPFKCSLCQSQYINNCPAKAKIKKELQPIVKEKFGQLLQLCVKCAIAVNHTENKGPTPEQRAEFEEEGKQFAQHLVKYLGDSAAARLYCSFYQTTKCGCIQCYITGTQANRRRKTSVSGAESEIADIAEQKAEDGAPPGDDKADETERARYLLHLLKESMAKKQAQNSKTSNGKNQQTWNENANIMKESEKFILENRMKLKELGICERGCQKVLCYSNNFLHKKSFGSQPRLQRTKGRAALGRLHALDDLCKMKCCEKNCVKLAVRNQSKLADWRQRAQHGQKEMWKVLEEMLTYTDSGKASCYKFICMVTGCCLTTVQKVYAEILLFRGTTSCPSQKEHGMRFHWKRQKELGKLLKVQAVTTAQEQPLKTEPPIHTSAVVSDASFDPTLITDAILSSAHVLDVKKEPKMTPLVMVTHSAASSQAETEHQLGEKAADGKEDKQDIKEKFLQLFENIKDPQEIVNMQLILAELQRDLKVKQEREYAQQVSASTASIQSSEAAAITESLSSSVYLPLSAPLALVPAISQTPNCSSSGVFPQIVQDSHVPSLSFSKTGRPFVHIKVQQQQQQTVPAEQQKASVHHNPQVASKEQIVAASSSASLHVLHTAQNATHPATDPPVVDDSYVLQAVTSSSQQITQRTLLSKLNAEPGKFLAQSKTSIPVVSGSSSRISMAKTPNETVCSESSLNHLSQQVGLFQVVAPPQTEGCQVPIQASQILSVYPQPTSLQIQPLPLPTSTNAQNIQFQLVSPLIIGQSNLMIPLNQPGTMSFILQNPATDNAQDTQSFLQAPALTSSSSISHRDFVISHVSPMQNFPASTLALSDSCEIPRNKYLSTFPSQTACNLAFSNNTCNIQYSKSDNTSASLNSGVHVTSEATIQNLRTHLDHFSESAEPHNEISSECQANIASMTEDYSSSSHSATAAVVHVQGIQPCGQGGELLHQVSNIDQYFPSVLLNQAAGNSLVGAPTSCSSSSFVFDALAESPVKDSLPLSSPSLHPVPIVTSSLLCEMLMSSEVSSMASNHLMSSPLLLATSTASYGSQTPVYTMNSQSSSSVKPSLLISALKSSPSTSTYCQSSNFSTHTTPSSLSNQPAVMTSKVEQTSLPIAVTIGHNASLSHSQINVSRLNRQRDPPQVGIVHPHVSGGKGSLGHTVNSHPYSSASSLSQNSVYSSSASNTSMAAVNVLGESLPSVSSSGLFTVNNSNGQVAASVHELSADILSNQSHSQQQQQQLLLSLLLNSQTANKTLINIPQASQFSLSALLGNHGSSMVNSTMVSDSHKRQTDAGSQNTINACDFHATAQAVSNPSLLNTTTDNGNFLPSQTSLSMGSLTPVSIGNQGILSGSSSTQLPTCDPQMFYPNTGHVKLVPVILSDGSQSGSIPGLFSQNGQLLLNMSPCSGTPSISPQNLNRDSSILLNLSPGSGQNVPFQHSLLQVEDIAQTTSFLPLASPSIQNIHHSREVGSFSKDQTKAIQISVLPFANQHGDGQLLAQVEFQGDSNLTQGMSSKESRRAKNFDKQMSFYTLPSPLRPVVEAAPTRKPPSDRPGVSSTDTAQNVYGQDNQRAQRSLSDRSRSQSGLSSTDTAQNVYGQDNQSGQNVLISCNLVKVSRSSETSHRMAEVARTDSASLPTPSLAETKSVGYTNTAVAEHHNPSVGSISENRDKSQVCLFSQTRNEQEDQQSQYQSTQLAVQQLQSTRLAVQQLQSTQLAAQQLQSTQLAAQQLQLPLQVVSVVQTQGEQANSDKFMASNVGTSFVLGQSAFQNFGLGQQLHSLLSMSNPNQIFLPIQSVPFSSHSNPGENISKTNQELQLDQQLSEPHKQIFVRSGDTSPLVPATQASKNVNTHITGTSLQSAVANSGSQLANMVTSSASSSKHRPIRPKLHPIPVPASKISLMLVPDKPGYPAYQLTQVDSTPLPFQPVSEQSSQSQLVSQQPQNAVLNPGASQQKQNSVSIAGSAQQQSLTRPLANTAFVTQLQPNQQASLPAQILLLSQSEIAQRSQNSETQAIIGHQNEVLTLPSQQMNTSVQAVLLGDKGCKAVNQNNDIPEMIPQQIVSIHPGPFHMTSDCETSGVHVLQSETLKISAADCESFHLKPFQNKDCQTGIFSNESVFVNTSQGMFVSDTLHSETFEVSSLQNSGFDPGCQQSNTLQFGCLEANVSEFTASQTAGSQLHSLALGSSQVIPVQQVMQTDIQRLNPQIASQLSGGDAPKIAHPKLVHVNAADGLGDLVITAYKGSQILPITQPENHHQAAAHQDVKLGTASSSLVGTNTSSFSRSECLDADVKAQAVENDGRSKVALDMRQIASSAFQNVQSHEIKTSYGSDFSTTMVCDQPTSSSEAPVYTQFFQTLIQPSPLMMGAKMRKREDTKPNLGPIQYLQCKEVIDLTEEDSPPLSPNSMSVNKGKSVSLVQLLSNQAQMYENLHAQIFSDNHISGQQRTISVPFQFESLAQQNPAKEGQYWQQQWGQLKQESKESHGAFYDTVVTNLSHGSDLPVVFTSSKKEQGPNVLKLEEIPEDIRQVLLASLESHAVGNPDVHLVTKAFTPSDDLSYHGFLSLRDQIHSASDTVDKNSCPGVAMLMSSNQQLEQPVARTQSQMPSVKVSDSKLGTIVHTQTDDKRLSYTRRSSSGNSHPELPSLSAVKIASQLKQEIGLAFASQESPSDVTAMVLSNQSSSSSGVSTTSSHRPAGPNSSPSLLLTTLHTAVPRSPIVKAPLGRTVIHPLTSSAVAFIRTNNTPTEAVGPPNITIMSSAQASTSPLRLRHDNNISVTTSATSPVIITSASSKPVSTMTKNQSSRLLKINSITSASASVRAQGTQDMKLSELCAASEGKDKAACQSGRRLSLENNFPVRCKEAAPEIETASASLSCKPVGSLLKHPEALTSSRSRTRKRQSTVFDLLKSKERLQATASAMSSPSFPVNSTSGPVTFMISGTPDLLLMDPSATQSGMNSNGMNIAVKNLHLLDKLTSNEVSSVPKQISSSSQQSGFAVLQPNILPSISGNCNIVSTPAHDTTVTATEHSPSAAVVSGSSIPRLQSQVSVSMTANRPQKTATAAEQAVNAAARGSSFTGSVSQPNILSGVLAQAVTLSSQPSSQSSASFYRSRDQGIELSGKGYSASREATTNSSTAIVQDSDFKHVHLQDVSKCDTEVQFQPIGQPQVACGSFNLKDKSVLDFLTQKPHAESFSGEKLKFKTTTIRNTGSGDRQQEIISNKFRLLEDTQINLPNQNTRTVKKLLLLNEKLSAGDSSKVHSSSLLRSSVQISDSSEQGYSSEKHLPQKSPQLLQLMKSKQSFSYTDFEQALHAKLSHSSGQDKCTPLKLPSSSVSMTVSGDNLIYDYSSSGASAHLSYHQSKEDFKQKDQLHVFITESSVPLLQPKENKMDLKEASGNILAGEASPDCRSNLLPSQHPLLATILFTGDSTSSPLQTSSSDSVGKSPVHFENQPNSSGKKRGCTEGNSYNSEHIAHGHQAPPDQLEHSHGSKREKHIQMSFEAEGNTVSGLSSLANRAPPAYNHPPRYEVSKKDMTRVNRVIEDIYKFPDEGEEPSPPPVFGGLKSHKFIYTHNSQERPAGSSAKTSNNVGNLSQSFENTSFSTASNRKSSPKTVQDTRGHSAVSSPSKSYISHVSGSSAQNWRSPKKPKAKRDPDRSNGKMNLKKVQFSDVVTSKSAPEYGQSTTVNSSVDTLPSEVDSNRRDKIKCSVQEYSVEDSRNLLGKHQRLDKDRQDNHIVYEKHPYTAEQLDTEFREGKMRPYHSGLTETAFTRPDSLQVNTKNKGNKTSGFTTVQRETDSISDFETEHQFGRDVNKVLQHQHLTSVSHTAAAAAAATTADGEQKFKHRAEKDIDPFQTLRQAHENACTFQSGFVQENMDNMCSFVNERAETGRMYSIQSTLRSCDQTVMPSTFEGMNNQCDDAIHSKVEESSRDLTKRKHAIHDESLQFGADPDHEVHSFERNNYMAEKKEFDLSSSNIATANCERDSTFDQQSSFNILSTQGYSKLSRQRLQRADTDHMWAESLTPAPFKPHGIRIDETGSNSNHYEDGDFPYQIRCESLPVGSQSSNNAERQLSDSPLSRQKILESNFEIARQMKKGHVRILKDSRSETSDGRKMESPQKFFPHPDRSEEISSSQGQRDTECQMAKDLEYRAPSGPASKLTSPIFSNTLDGRPDVLTSLESLSCLRKEIKDLRGQNHYLKLEVARAEQKGKEQQRQRQLSTSDKQRASSTEAEKTEKSYYTSSSSTSSQSYMADADTVTPMRKRHTSSTATVGALNYSLFSGSEQLKPEEGFQNKVCQLSLGSTGIHQMLDSDISFPDGNHRSSAAEALFARSSINIDDSPEHYIRDTRDPLVSSSMSSHSRPTSQLDLGMPQYEIFRHKYPFSEVKSGPLRSISDGDGFVPLLEHTRHRNLSSSLGFHALSDVDPPPYDITQRQRNPSASSLKSTFQDADILNVDVGARSRNPSSSSWVRYLDYGADFAIIRSRNPSGSSNRRSRPGSSSSSERDHPVNVDELPLFSDIAHTRSRNSSGESIEPTLDLILDPQQFMQYTQYTYQAAEAHSKRTKH